MLIIHYHDTHFCHSCFKKQDAAELSIKLDEEKFQKLMKVLGKISKDLQVQLQKKSLLLGK